MIEEKKPAKFKTPPNTACTGRLGLGAFFEAILWALAIFRFASWFSPAAGNASRWAASLVGGKSNGSKGKQPNQQHQTSR